ncbi:uncharacterized protein LOC120509458 isoform X2 [Passer montanus]|uniref:uncharacterized protein LOC120509458 isoform X2 n=1 Tax=Passer montanus TaxID=9160 RepID=UPI0019603C39|nr:uncharacterized protein LOC120509458 isoform X2 [Passer montanus]
MNPPVLKTARSNSILDRGADGVGRDLRDPGPAGADLRLVNHTVAPGVQSFLKHLPRRPLQRRPGQPVPVCGHPRKKSFLTSNPSLPAAARDHVLSFCRLRRPTLTCL